MLDEDRQEFYLLEGQEPSNRFIDLCMVLVFLRLRGL